MNILHKALRNCLGQGMDLQPRRKEWLPVALAAASFASSVIGGQQASRAARAAERRQRAREAEENAYFTRRYNEDYADTAAGQNLLRRAKDYARENWRKAAGAQAVAGGTDAAAAMAKEAGNKMVGDTVANIAAQDTARKANADAQHQIQRNQFAQMDMNREQARANAITQAAQGASNAMMTAAGALAQDNAGANLKGGSNNSTTASTGTSTPSVDYDAIRQNNSYYANMSDADIAEHLYKMGVTTY